MKNDPSRFGHIIQLFTVLLTAILISLFFAVLVLVGKIQGTPGSSTTPASCAARPSSSSSSKFSGTPEDALLGDMASYIEGLASAAASWTLCGWTTRIFRPR